MAWTRINGEIWGTGDLVYLRSRPDVALTVEGFEFDSHRHDKFVRVTTIANGVGFTSAVVSCGCATQVARGRELPAMTFGLSDFQGTRHELEKRPEERLLDAIELLREIGCFCEHGVDNPMVSSHSDTCQRAHDMVREHDRIMRRLFLERERDRDR